MGAQNGLCIVQSVLIYRKRGFYDLRIADAPFNIIIGQTAAHGCGLTGQNAIGNAYAHGVGTGCRKKLFFGTSHPNLATCLC